MDTKQLSKKQKHWLEDESGAWVEQGIIEPQQQARILGQYSTSHAENFYSSWSSLLLISLGAILIGGGVILLIAHNWEHFGKGTRTVLSILPLILAQALAWHSARYKPQLAGLREAAGILLFFAVAASIALISQTYHIYGDLESFLFTWLVLTIPVLYLLGSAGVLILICGVTLWLCGLEREPYWLLYLLLLPYLYGLYQQQRHILFQTALWFVVIGIAISIIYTISWKSPIDNWAIFIMLGLAAFYYCLGHWLSDLRGDGFWSNPLLSVGAVTIASISLMLTWDNFYRYGGLDTKQPFALNDYLVLAVFAISLSGIIVFAIKNRSQLNSGHWALLASTVLVVLGLTNPRTLVPDIIYILIANLYVLTASIILMWQGINQHRLMLLNGGLLWFSFLVLFRFFDSDIPFVLKGVVFILIGSAFLGVNIWYNKKMRQQPAQENAA